jgi:hypothetical protein
MGKAGKPHVENNFSLGAFGARLEQCVCGLAEGKGKAE